MAYTHRVYLESLQHEALHIVQNDYDLESWLDFVAFPKSYRKDITGIVVLIHEGDICAMWLTEYAAYYDLSAVYHPLPYYSQYAKRRNAPEYHKESCECYDLSRLDAICDKILATGR